MEIWKEIKGYEGLYEVSSLGKVRSLDRTVLYKNGQIHIHKGKLLVPGVSKLGYMQVCLCRNGEMKHPLIHRLVAETFLPNPENLPQINHKDENPSNNVLENLEWCSVEYNINYGTRTKKAIESNINNGHYRPEFVGLDSKEYYRRKRQDSEYRRKHCDANRRWRERQKNLV